MFKGHNLKSMDQTSPRCIQIDSSLPWLLLDSASHTWITPLFFLLLFPLVWILESLWCHHRPVIVFHPFSCPRTLSNKPEGLFGIPQSIVGGNKFRSAITIKRHLRMLHHNYFVPTTRLFSFWHVNGYVGFTWPQWFFPSVCHSLIICCMSWLHCNVTSVNGTMCDPHAMTIGNCTTKVQNNTQLDCVT